MAYEKVTLYGIPLVTSRKVNSGGSTRRCRRELFIRHALVEGDWQTHHRSGRDNRGCSTRSRSWRTGPGGATSWSTTRRIFAFYDQRIPADVVSGRHFDTWWKTDPSRGQPDLLTFTRRLLVNARPRRRRPGRLPGRVAPGELTLPLTYTFEPGTAADGVTVDIPLPLLNQVPAESFDWQVPGLREDLVIALIRSLPKSVRRNFVPVPDYAARPGGRNVGSHCWTR